MRESLRVLLVEDNPADAEMIVRTLRQAGFEPDWTRVETEAAYLSALDPSFDVILSDHAMPQFDGPRALELLTQSGLDIPFLTVSGTIGEDIAVESIKKGAADYLLKDRLSRLGQSVRQSLNQKRLRQERQRTEDALRESEERLKLALASSRMGVWEWNADTGAVFWSPECKEMLGTSNLRSDLDAFAEWLHPDDAEEALRNWRAALAKREDYHAHFRVLTAEGRLRWLANVARPGGRRGGAQRMVGTLQDITDRKESEERIVEQAALLDQARDAILVRDLSQHILFWNQGAERLYGWKAAEVLGKDATSLLYRKPSSHLEEVLRLVLQNGEWSGELRQRNKSDSDLMVESRWTLLRDASGRPRSILSINTDVTEKKRLESQFLRAQRLESIGTLAGGIAHDLNNVLTPIMMSIDLLKARIKDPLCQGTLDTIAASTKRGADMVSQVLSFARGVEGARMQVNLKRLIEDVLKIGAESFPKNIQFKHSCDPQLWNVAGDPTQLHQVLLNLCINSRDAMMAGGWLTIRAENVVLDKAFTGIEGDADASKWVVIQVADTGTGIQADVLERIFDPFFTTKELGRGTGLGLSSSLAIIKSHGGFIRVESEVGKGTEFNIYVPASTSDIVPAVVTPEATPPRGSGELVLVIDDEAPVREITRETLESFGYRVVLAGDGAEAVATVASQQGIAVVLTDLMMPVMDGVSTVQVLARIAPGLPVIAASGHAAQGSLAALASLGVRHFLPKPYTGEALLLLLRQVLAESVSKSKAVAGC